MRDWWYEKCAPQYGSQPQLLGYLEKLNETVSSLADRQKRQHEAIGELKRELIVLIDSQATRDRHVAKEAARLRHKTNAITVRDAIAVASDVVSTSTGTFGGRG